MSFQRILIGVCENPAAVRAMEVGAALAKSLGAQISLVHVIDPKLASSPEGGYPATLILEECRQDARRLLKSASLRIGGDPPPWEYLVEGSPSREIVRTAEEWNADLIVVGTHARSGLARAFLGSTAEGIVRHSRIPVLSVPGASQ